MKNKIWSCKIGEVDVSKVPEGGDLPMHEAIARAYRKITGEDPAFLFSGWGAKLDELERAVVENRPPRDDYVSTELAKRASYWVRKTADQLDGRHIEPNIYNIRELTKLLESVRNETLKECVKVIETDALKRKDPIDRIYAKTYGDLIRNLTKESG